jgi:predicted nucleotidyltransferase
MRILLLGSYTRGEQGEDSDVDLHIIMPLSGRRVAKSVEIRLKANPSFPVDLIVRIPNTGEVAG